MPSKLDRSITLIYQGNGLNTARNELIQIEVMTHKEFICLSYNINDEPINLSMKRTKCVTFKKCIFQELKNQKQNLHWSICNTALHNNTDHLLSHFSF